MEIVLNTFGVSLNRDNEAFVVTSKDGRQRIPVDGIKSIQISRGAQITSDAVMLAVEHEIDVMFWIGRGIIVCPVSSDILRSMKIIGQNINLDVITQSKNTLFF